MIFVINILCFWGDILGIKYQNIIKMYFLKNNVNLYEILNKNTYSKYLLIDEIAYKNVWSMSATQLDFLCSYVYLHKYVKTEMKFLWQMISFLIVLRCLMWKFWSISVYISWKYVLRRQWMIFITIRSKGLIFDWIWILTEEHEDCYEIWAKISK